MDMKPTTYEALSEIQKKMLDEAEKAMGNSYNPYSGFSVGAALLTDDGGIITGTNVENAAYGNCICAERTALVRAVATGYKQYLAIAVIAKGKGFDVQEVAAPCGSCRQMLFEASQITGHNLEVIMATTKKDKILISSISELLPLAFGPKNLGIETRNFGDTTPSSQSIFGSTDTRQT